MAIRYFERSGTWEFDSVKEAKAFRNESQETPVRAKGSAAAGQAPHKGGPKDTVRKALTLLAGAGDKGLLAGEIAPKVGLKSPKGMSGLAHSIEQYLVQAVGEAEAKRAFWKTKDLGRPARWFADPGRIRALNLGDGST
jgi:hypothetical protein